MDFLASAYHYAGFIPEVKIVMNIRELFTLSCLRIGSDIFVGRDPLSKLSEAVFVIIINKKGERAHPCRTPSFDLKQSCCSISSYRYNFLLLKRT